MLKHSNKHRLQNIMIYFYRIIHSKPYKVVALHRIRYFISFFYFKFKLLYTRITMVTDINSIWIMMINNHLHKCGFMRKCKNEPNDNIVYVFPFALCLFRLFDLSWWKILLFFNLRSLLNKKHFNYLWNNVKKNL